MYWNWKKGGIALGLCFFLALLFVKPIGVSTQFVIFDAMIASQLNPVLITESSDAPSGYQSSNAYLNKSGGKYAKAAANPVNYSFLFVIAMIAGGILGRLAQRASGNQSIEQVPDFHAERFGSGNPKRYLLAFLGGAIVLFGARLAGGCTSGHMMSGMMQTAVSGYLFAAAAFLAAVPTAIFFYRR